MRAGRIIVVIVGALLAFAGFGAVVGGGALTVVDATQRDGAGYYTSRAEQLQTSTAVLVARLDLGSATRAGDFVPAHPLGTIKITAVPVAGGGPLFLGIAPAARVHAWLAGRPSRRGAGL